MNLDLDDIADMNIQSLGIDTRTEAGKKEIRELAFVEDALSEDDAIESMFYPYGRPSKWDLIYNKWFSMDLTNTGGFPSYLMILSFLFSRISRSSTISCTPFAVVYWDSGN